MKITKKQINAALALADGTETDKQIALCEAASDSVVIPAYDGCINILAVAYRELLAENQELNKKLDKWESLDYVGESPY